MTNLVITELFVDVNNVYHSETGPASEAIAKGQYCRFDTSTGKITPAKATTAGECRDGGIASKTVAAGQTVTIYIDAIVDVGDALSAIAFDADIYLSDTDGLMTNDEADATIVKRVATVIPAWGGGGTADKLLWVRPTPTAEAIEGVTATPTELNYLAGVTPGTRTASKALVVGASGQLDALLVTNASDGATNALTALAGGGASGATALPTTFNRITTCATNKDSVILPAATAGLSRVVVNKGVAYAHVYPATGEVIDSLSANVPVSLPAGATITFRCTVTGTWDATPLVPTPKYSTGTTTTTFAAGQLTGGSFVTYKSTAGTPGSIATRTATQMFDDDPNARVGGTYMLRITNDNPINNLTVTAGSGVTLTGTAIIGAQSSADYVVTYTSATALVIQNLGS